MGVVMLENEIAAAFNAFKEAVRLDLKADLRDGLISSIEPSCSQSPLAFAKALKSNESTFTPSLSDKGCSRVFCLVGEDTDGSLRFLVGEAPGLGVSSDGKDNEES